MWNETVEHLSRTNKCYTISILGFGGLKSVKDNNFTDIKDKLISYIKKHKIKKAALIGHSFGGSLAIELVAANPDLFSKLIIVDAYSFPLDVFVPGISSETAHYEADKLFNTLLKLDEAAFKTQQETQLKEAVTDPEKLEEILNWQLNSDRNLFASAMSRMIAMDHRPELKNIKIPCLVIGTWEAMAKYGFSKERTRMSFEDQYKNIDNHKIIIAEKGRHFIMFDEQDWFNQQLDLFLQ
jgi:pimeloyl-ACP methyl ester carboxylesterase